jgi:dienelactone hydrolase
LWYPARISFDWKNELFSLDASRQVPEAPLAAVARPLPVLLYFPGWGAKALDNRVLVAELVSQGFVVATLTYPRRLPTQSDAEFQAQLAEQAQPLDFSSEAAYSRTLELGAVRVKQGARDATAVLDALQRLNRAEAGGRFSGRLDLQKVGVFGHSFGGAVAAQTCRSDPRFAAALNLDGWLFGEVAEAGVPCAYLMMSDGSPLPTAEDLLSADPSWRYTAQLTSMDYSRTQANLKRLGGIYMSIQGSRHEHLSDSAWRNPLRRYGLSGGGLSGQRAGRLVQAYTLAFFRQTLQASPSPLLQPGDHSHPEVEVKVWPQPGS